MYILYKLIDFEVYKKYHNYQWKYEQNNSDYEFSESFSFVHVNRLLCIEMSLQYNINCYGLMVEQTHNLM